MLENEPTALSRVFAASGGVLRLRRPDRSSLEFALRAGVATAVSVWLGERIGLQDSYWAGISAVVATAGTLGASLGAAFSRISATFVGLLVGLAALALPVSGTLVSGATVAIALVILPALSLDAGARLGAATTLIVTAIPGHHAVGDAVARGLNVPLGCTVAIAVGLIVPRRAAERLRADLRADVRAGGAIIHSALLSYVGAAPAEDLPRRLAELARSSSARAATLRDAAREPAERGERLDRLRRQVATVAALVEHARSLVEVVIQGSGDTVPSLVRAELEHAANAFAEASAAAADPSDEARPERGLARANRALAALDAAFSDARARRATAAFPTEELARLLSVIRSLNAAGSALSELAPRT